MNKLQKIFNKVAKHLLKQNAKSTSDTWTSLYRAENGLKCAAGCLVSDKEYDATQENWGWRMTKWCAKYTEEENDLILILQQVHDDYPVKAWKSELVRVAKENDLKLIPELK